MESSTSVAPAPVVLPEGSGAGEKGLKTGAIGFISGVVIGVASTAPGYSLAGALGLAPTLGGLMLLAVFVKSCVDLSDPANSESGNSWLGLGPPLVIAILFVILGAFLIALWRSQGHPEFFGRKREVADPALVAASAAGGT